MPPIIPDISYLPLSIFIIPLPKNKPINEIEKIASERHKIISSSEDLTLNYTFLGNEISEISDNLRKELKERRSEELARRQACVGPHRDDLELRINSLDATKFASQGQQRTVVLSLKLSELEIIKEKIGFYPILLLDDVLAELDDTRQNYLLKSIDNSTQTIITSVDTLFFDKEFLNGAQIIQRHLPCAVNTQAVRRFAAV